MTKQIKKHDGKRVTKQTMSLRGTGDGLSKALAIDPIGAHIGDEITLVVRGEVVSHQYKADQKGNEDLTEVIVVNGGTITVANDVELVNEMLREQAEKNQVAQEKTDGVHRLPGTPGADDDEDDDES